MKTGKKEFLFYTDWDDRVTGSASALAGRLVSFATEFGLSGNVWQQWLTYTLMMHENAFTRACERREILPDSTLMKLAKLDLGTFMELFGADDSDFDDDEKVLSMMLSYKAPYDGECITGAGRRIEELSSRLASTEDIGEFARILTTKKWSMHRDLGLYFGRHSTTSSYLCLTLAIVCGMALVKGGSVMPERVLYLDNSNELDPKTWRTPVTHRFPVSCVFPEGVFPDVKAKKPDYDKCSKCGLCAAASV